MESSNEKIKLFNSILESFLAQTSVTVGTSYHYYFLKLIKTNATLPINHAITHLLNYKEQIINKDEKYFENDNNYKEKLTDENDNKIENALSEIMRLKDIYYKLNDESKENVWSILQALLQLTIEYNQIKNNIN